MAQELIIKLIVEDNQVEQAVLEIEKLGGSIKKVNDTTLETGKTLGDTMDSAGQATKNLKDGVEGAARQVRVLGKAAKTSGKAMRSALIATGIGALVVAVGLLVDNWEAIGEAIGLINKDFEKQNQLLQDNTKIVNSRLSLLNKEIKFNKLRDKSNEENLKYQKDLLLEKKKLLAENILLLETQLATAKSQATELSLWQKFLGRTKAKGDVGIIDEDEKENIDALTLQLNKLKEAAIDVESILNPPPENTPPDKQKRDTVTAIGFGGETGIADPYNEQKEKDAKRLTALREGTEEFAVAENERIDIEVQGLVKSAEIANKKTEIEKQALKERIADAKEEEDRKKQIRYNALNNLIMIAGRETKVGKALLIAKQALLAKELIMEASKTITFSAQSAARSTVAVAEGTAQTAKVGFPQNIPLLIGYAAQAAGIISAIMGATKKATQIGTSFGGGGGFSPVSVETPSFNVVGTGGVTQSQFQESLQAQDTPIRAYVVSGDVTSSQEFERNVENSSSIG